MKKHSNILLDILQKLYDYIISFFINRNYIYENLKNSENFSQEFSVVINNENRKDKIVDNHNSNSIYHIKEKIKHFNNFIHLIKLTLKSLKNMQHLVDLKEMQSDLFKINYKIDYGGVSKDASNNAIFAFAYSIFEFYKRFKEKTFIEENDENYFEYINSLKNYIEICNEFKIYFHSIENFKFYERQDLNSIKFLDEKDNNNKTEKESIYFLIFK